MGCAFIFQGGDSREAVAAHTVYKKLMPPLTSPHILSVTDTNSEIFVHSLASVTSLTSVLLRTQPNSRLTHIYSAITPDDPLRLTRLQT